MCAIPAKAALDPLGRASGAMAIRHDLLKLGKSGTRDCEIQDSEMEDPEMRNPDVCLETR